jgi:hypothetical protein
VKLVTTATAALILLSTIAHADERAARPVRGAQVASPKALVTPAIRVVALETTPKTSRYVVEVTNVSAYPSGWFPQSGPPLPPNPCGTTRMFGHVMVRQNGATRAVACKALASRSDLHRAEFTLDAPLGNDDVVQFAVQDRTLNTHATSEKFLGGWIGVAKMLGTVGCKPFLGRAGSFLCAHAKGFSACEDLRKGGKPLECRQAGGAQ